MTEDVGGGAGAGNQSFLLARAGYEVTLLDSSPEMLARAMAVRPALEQRWSDALAAFDERTEG